MEMEPEDFKHNMILSFGVGVLVTVLCLILIFSLFRINLFETYTKGGELTCIPNSMLPNNSLIVSKDSLMGCPSFKRMFLDSDELKKNYSVGQ